MVNIKTLKHCENLLKVSNEIKQYVNVRRKKRFFGTVTLTTQPGFYLFLVSNRNTEARCEMCSKLTVRIPERPQ